MAVLGKTPKVMGGSSSPWSAKAGYKLGGSSLLLVSMFIGIATLLIWASLSKIDQVTHGGGKVVASTQMQTIQSVEGGTIKNILVKEGDVVEPGQPLIEIDQATVVSQYNQTLAQYYGLMARAERLTAEIAGTPPKFDDALVQKASAVVTTQSELYRQRQAQLVNDKEVLQNELVQRQQEVNENNVTVEYAERSITSLQAQEAIIKPLVDKGIESKMTLMDEERQINDLQGKAEASKAAQIRLNAAILEVQNKIKGADEKFRADALSELGTVTAQVAEVEQAIPALKDRVDHNVIRSPIKGIVNRVLDYTIGGVAPAATPLLEIVPFEDKLKVEANISPKDIAFIHVGQPVEIKLSAYDFARYGGLTGTVTNVSADAVKVSKDDNNTAYIVQISTDRNYLETESDHQKYYIMPGMQADANIITGKRTILNYLISPVLRLKQNAMQE